MEIRQLHTFREVTRSLSFTRTAQTLNYAQSSVSAQIQSLEEELGVTLFDRLGRRVVLTAAGQRLQGYAEKILALADEALAAVPDNGEPVGLLTIGAPETLCAYRLPAVVNAFRSQFPKVDIVFCPSLNGADWSTLLSEGLADAALSLAEPFHSSTVYVKPLRGEPILVVATPTHRLAKFADLRLEDFQTETMLLTEADCRYRRVFMRAMRSAAVSPANILEFHSLEAIKQCALTGMGVAILPQVVVQQELTAGRLVNLRVEGLAFNMVTQMLWHKDKWVSPALQAFLEMTEAMLGQAEAPEVDQRQRMAA
ncbi:MAG: LysR family transcriptional regulator [Caldilineaceae bacterium]